MLQQNWTWEVAKKKCQYDILSLSPPSVPPFSLYPFSFPGGPLPQMLGRGVWRIGGFGQIPANKRFLVHSELKMTLLVMALLQKFSNNQVYIVICNGPVTYRCGTSQKGSGGMVSSQPLKCWYGVASHFQPCQGCYAHSLPVVKQEIGIPEVWEINPFTADPVKALHFMPYWSNPPFIIFDIWALWRSVLSARAI